MLISTGIAYCSTIIAKKLKTEIKLLIIQIDKIT